MVALMSPKHTPARWFSALIFLCGLYVFSYLAFTQGHVFGWIFPTGIVALMVMRIGVRWFIRRLPLLVVSLGLVSCQYDPHAHLLTTKEPLREAIVGTYVVDRFELTPELSGKSAAIVIELRENGTFSAKNVPPWQGDLPQPDFFDTLITGTGQWEMKTMGLLQPGNLPIYGVYLRNGPKMTSPTPPGKDPFEGLMSPAQLTGNKPPYGMIFQIGDPDSGYAILMKKEP